MRRCYDGTEYWSARELAPALEYSKWENFHKVIKRAMISCENSGRSIHDQIPDLRKLVEGGVAPRSKIDYELTRYACYLIVQNAGYMGLYGGLDVDDIHSRKNLEVGQKILDYMGSTELIANLFRISQTEEKLRKDSVKEAEKATSVQQIEQEQI